MENEKSLVKEIKMVKTDSLEPVEFNPNHMSERKFNQLVGRIKEQGFKDPISVVPSTVDEGKYKIIEGEHRWRAAMFLEIEEVPVFIHDDWDEDKQKFEIVKSNVLKGKMDPLAFTKLVNSLSDKYSHETIQEMMGFQDENEFSRLYQEIKKQLPEDLQNKLDDVKDEIKTIDDLSAILNRLFNDYGDTLEYNFMIFDYSGKDQLWVKCDKPMWEKVNNIANACKMKGRDINEVLPMLLKDISEIELTNNEEVKTEEESKPEGNKEENLEQ